MKYIKSKKAIIFIAILMISVTADGSNWELFKGSETRVGYSDELIGAKLNPLWNVEYDDLILSSPVMFNDKVAIGTRSGEVIFLNALNGAELWAVQTGNAVQAVPAIDNDNVYAPSVDKTIYIINKSSGNITGSYQTEGWLESSPLYVGNSLYVTSEDHHLYALSKNTGQFIWKYQAGGDIFSSPAYSDGLIFFGCDDDYAYAVNTSGTLVWQTYLHGAPESTPVIADGKVVFVTVGNNTGLCHNNIYALNPSDGSVIWNRRLGNHDLLYSSPAVGYGMLFYATQYGNLGALSLQSGSTIWENPGDTYGYYSSPILVDRMLIIGSNNGNVGLFDPFSGKLMVSFQTGDIVYSSPAISDGIMTVGSFDHKLYAFDITSALNITIGDHGEEVSPGEILTTEISVNNSSNQSDVFDAWIEVTTPDGQTYRIEAYRNIQINANQTLSAQLNIGVPVYAPLGDYVMTFKIGGLPQDFDDFGSFRFKVISGMTVAEIGGNTDRWYAELLNGFEGELYHESTVPNEFTAEQNYPNPFNAQTHISFGIPEEGDVNLSIYNVLGQRVKTLYDGEMQPGYHTLSWDASDYAGGVYFYRLSAADRVTTKRMTLLK
ncbi:MAG: PQQ-binding-like beta-propeller repeat protein [candidate division Zixibacteria bacterium]|nr:PQQ-binding-like beta-propeller repeat protein [candidate division Zixibacteria bacterium]